jgi:hypothetical protein
VTLSATLGNSLGVLRLIANLPSVAASCVRLQLGPLPSTGITRLPQYCEPLRHPSRPGPSLTSCQLILAAITAGTSRVAYGPLCRHAVANTPAGLTESCSLVSFHQLRPSPKSGRVGSCISRFEACSAFTHVTACLLTESLNDLLHQRLQQSRCLHRCSDCYRVERTSSRAGLTPAVDHHLFTAHPISGLTGSYPQKGRADAPFPVAGVTLSSVARG